MKTMGIDLGQKKAAFSVWEDGVLVLTEAYESKATMEPEWLNEVSGFIIDALYEVNADVVFIEEPLIGNNRKYSLNIAKMYGAVLSAMATVNADIGLKVLGVNVSMWKKETVGKGNATKDMVRQWLTELDCSYPDLCGSDQDRIDAAAIGYYGWGVAERADRAISISG